jgi:hypothetical protein
MTCCLDLFIFFILKGARVAFFTKHLMFHLSTKFDKNLHANNGLTSDYTLVWSFLAN